MRVAISRCLKSPGLLGQQQMAKERKEREGNNWFYAVVRGQGPIEIEAGTANQSRGSFGFSTKSDNHPTPPFPRNNIQSWKLESIFGFLLPCRPWNRVFFFFSTFPLISHQPLPTPLLSPLNQKNISPWKKIRRWGKSRGVTSSPLFFWGREMSGSGRRKNLEL